MKKDKRDISKQTSYPTQAMVMIRFFAATYLVYTAFSLGDVGARYSGTEVWIYRIAQILFVVAGVVLGGISGRDLVQGRYVGGKMDNSAEEETGAMGVVSKEENVEVREDEE